MLFGKMTVWVAPTKRWELFSASLKHFILHKILEIILQERFVYCLLFIYFIMLVQIHRYLFYTFNKVKNFFYSIVQIILALAIWYLSHMLLWHTSLLLFYFCTTKCSRPPITSHGISHFLMKSRFSLLDNGIRNQNPGARCACCYWGVIDSVIT